VTGAGSGLGRALCLELARRGARVVASDVNLATADETVRLMQGGEGIALRCDVTKPDQVEDLAGEAFARLGGVDLLVNNAGVAVAGPVGDVPLADWEWVVGVNLWGVIYGCHAFVPRMVRQGSGHVLNVASAAGLLNTPKMAPYNVTKAGVVALSETMRGDLHKTGVGVTVLCPTFFPTNIGRSGRAPAEIAKVMEQLVESGKSTAEEVARLALEGCDRNELYVTPHADGRWMWRLKRLMPSRFYDMLPTVMELRMRAR
jgi:NAD(P)-dependent dehydrogenase (short-subunit alcohol dehydrogenase family)